MHDVELMKYNVFIKYKGKKFELSALNKLSQTASYRDGEKIITIPISQIDFVESNDEIETISK